MNEPSLKRVLVVEDNGALRTSLKTLLEHAGFDVVAVAEFRRARQLVQEELFDALITDLDLPDGTGLDLLASARSIRPRMRSVLMTGYSCTAIRKQAGELPLLAYLEKPFDPAELLDVLR